MISWLTSRLPPSQCCVLDHRQPPLSMTVYRSVVVSLLLSPGSVTAGIISVFGLEGYQAVHTGRHVL